MRRILLGGIAVCMLSLFVPPIGALRDVPRADAVTRTPVADARAAVPQSARTPQKELSPNAALLLIMTVALRGLHGS